MNGLYEAALDAQRFMEAYGWSSCLIGGLAVVRWGRPRTTHDVDMTLLTGFGSEEMYIRELLSRYKPRLDDAARFARENRVLLVSASNGIPIDISLGGLPFEEGLVSRATPFAYARGVSLITCSAEDLVVLKAFAARDQDWADVEGIVVRQGGRLDWDHVRRELAPLCELKEEPEILEHLRRIRRRVEESP